MTPEIQSDNELIIAAIADLLIPESSIPNDLLDENSLMCEIENALIGQKTLSETIIEERREGL